MNGAVERKPKPYRVLVADDHAIVRKGVRALLESQPDVEVCYEAGNGREALELVRKSKPDLVVLDLTMPELNGLEATRAIREASPATEVLILTMHYGEEVARAALEAGARGYVLKSDASSELLLAVDRIRRGKSYFTAILEAAMAKNFAAGPAAAAQEGSPAGSPLTPRELEIVQLLAEGKSNKEAAAALNLSVRTIEAHRNRVMRKMNFRNFADLVRFALRSNLIAP